MDNAKEIKVHDTVLVNLKPIFGTDDDNLAGYAKVLHIEENKNEGVTYYDVCFRGSGAAFYGVEDYYVHPITSTEAVLPQAPKDNGTTRTDKEDTLHDKHYRDSVVEPILVMQDFFSREELIGFLKGNILKYRLRAGHKGTKEEMQADWDKIHVYEKWLEAIKNGERITL